ncbi:TRIC cation channel family protein [Cellulomonas sp. ATA003]|uniref:trimeric intracellular cation channel family protein n=1 Tax=Cellulomonas sp. ATA003 TaxID=3073064 RepID=UPI002872EEAF|nr:TRIC cation channel family protein [Cellulomonas sp. ATA003]WNB87605.1 TRIC cation channel family protein [Cellulomonas sp. ATA003]
MALLALDLVGVFAFALSGGLAAVRKRFDVVGVLVLAAAAGLGGGILRDVLIGAVPPVNISDWRLLAAATAAGLLTFFFHPRVSRIQQLVLVLDAVGLGLFAVAGTLKALELGTTPHTAVVVGVLTGVGGGAIRDLLAGEPPRVLAHRELYAIPAVLGASVVAVAWWAGVAHPAITWGSVALVVTLRLLALWRNWQAPAPRPPLG